MIDSAINYISGQLNQYLKRSFDLSEDIVLVSNILEQDGTVAPHVENRVLAFLVNVEKDTTPHRNAAQTPQGDKSLLALPPVYLNLYVMFAGCFTGNNYSESLKFISNVVNFFQQKPMLDRQNSPDMDDNIEKLTLEIVNLDMRDLSSMWGMLSSRYLPSVLYKVRMVAYDAGVQGQAVKASKPETSVAQ